MADTTSQSLACPRCGVPLTPNTDPDGHVAIGPAGGSPTWCGAKTSNPTPQDRETADKLVDNLTGEQTCLGYMGPTQHDPNVGAYGIGKLKDTIAVALTKQREPWMRAFADLSMGKHLDDAKREMRGWQALIELHDTAIEE